ncbi:hypothetical protein [Endozoicomonas sp. 8E]|uniref:hypothetical protein n=1 Tax=Endozoicomonas sp. 8E TaxID=3035692 RepID=UPI0029393856|nr:hypothetical protein [Endozoicomonas sp. 8E]WOG29624.1 hypothetical protein P6910_08210 [Endozoicomonas sp. 8E]
MNDPRVNSEKETFNWKADASFALGKPEPIKWLSVKTLQAFAISGASFLIILMALGFASVNYADLSGVEDDDDQPETEQFMFDDDDSGTPEPAPYEPNLDEMEDQGELEGYDPDEAD